MMTFAELSEIIRKLEEPFPAEDHKERPLKGGDRWFYIPWQKIRERLDQVCVWQDFYSDFTYSPDGQRCIVTCTIEIGGYKRQGIGSVPLVELSNAGKDCSRGEPEQRAVAAAFKAAAEQWGVARYLDDQAFVTRHLRKYHDGRPVAYARKNQNQYTMPRPQRSQSSNSGQISREEWLKLQRSN